MSSKNVFIEGVFTIINKRQKNILLVFLCVVIMILLTACEEGTGSKTIVLGFLPSGMEVATGHRILNNTDFRIITLIPILEPLFSFVISILCNVIDFFLWFIAWIPGVKQGIAFIYSLPDLDQTYKNFFPNHRNFITHSVLNPGFLLVTLIGIILSKVNKSFILREAPIKGRCGNRTAMCTCWYSLGKPSVWGVEKSIPNPAGE